MQRKINEIKFRAEFHYFLPRNCIETKGNIARKLVPVAV